MFSKLFAVVASFAALVATNGAQAEDLSRASLVAIVRQIQRADYEGNRAALLRLHGQLEDFLQNKQLFSRVEYWRAFALWRRALNGFNDSIDPGEIRADLEQAAKEFNQSSAADPAFVDAKIGAISCLSNLMFLNRGNPVQLKDLIAQSSELSKEATTEAPDNPRLYWVLGPNLWYAPLDRGGSQTGAIEMYKKGLDLARKGKAKTTDPLEPSWGEPELLMNLAWSSLHQSVPAPEAAHSYALSALKLVPYWHYVKQILLPQIQQAIQNSKSIQPGC